MKKLLFPILLVLLAGTISSTTLAGTISGRVTGSDGVTALPGILAWIYSYTGSGWLYWGASYTDADGQYVSGDLPAGTYIIQFYDHSGTYLDEVYENAPYLDAGTGIPVSDDGMTSGIDASLVRASKITGTVTGPNGVSPLSGIQVVAMSWTGLWWDWIESQITDAAGQYRLSVAPGTYRVQFADQMNGIYCGEVYDNVTDLDSGVDVVVSEGASVSNINAVLVPGSSIAGHVTGADGVTPLGNITVQVYTWNGTWWRSRAQDQTDMNGAYRIGGLAPGTYRVDFHDWAANRFVPEAYRDVPELEQGIDIPLAEGTAVSNIDASLAPGATIAGRVTAADGVTPLVGISVQACSWNGSWWDYKGNGRTDSAGDYRVNGLAAGTYRVGFYDWGAYRYVSEVYRDAPDLDAGVDIPLAAGSTVSNINGSLDEYARISGKVTYRADASPVGSFEIVLVDVVNEWNYWGYTVSANGHYERGQLPPGRYAARVMPVGSGSYLGQWYGDVVYVPGQPMPPGAVVMDLGSGTSVSNVDFALDRAGSISGTVTWAMGGLTNFPLPEVELRVEGLTNRQSYWAGTGLDGRYVIDGLVPDSYVLKAEAEAFRDEWWSKAGQKNDATPLAVGVGAGLTCDFSLTPGQGQALVEVTSDPAGATVYLDYQPTTNVTPAIVDVGDPAIWASSHVSPLGGRAARMITVAKPGRPRPAPVAFQAFESETVTVHFDLTADTAGLVAITTTPGGAEVFVDRADVAEGLSPVVVGNLAPGSHVILLRKPGQLQPRPVEVAVEAGLTNLLLVALATNTTPGSLTADVRSVPPGATVYVDYLATTQVTDVVVGGLDAARYAGVGWQSASHTIMLRRPGTLPSAPRYVADLTDGVPPIVIHPIRDVVGAVDQDHDDLPDQWEEGYRLHQRAPGQDGALDDPDHDGLNNGQEMVAGTDPLDPTSTLSASETEPGVTVGADDSVTFVFATVPGRGYILQSCNELGEGWRNLTGCIVAVDYQTAFTVSTADGPAGRFCRLVVLGP